MGGGEAKLSLLSVRDTFLFCDKAPVITQMQRRFQYITVAGHKTKTRGSSGELIAKK